MPIVVPESDFSVHTVYGGLAVVGSYLCGVDSGTMRAVAFPIAPIFMGGDLGNIPSPDYLGLAISGAFTYASLTGGGIAQFTTANLPDLAVQENQEIRAAVPVPGGFIVAKTTGATMIGKLTTDSVPNGNLGSAIPQSLTADATTGQLYGIVGGVIVKFDASELSEPEPGQYYSAIAVVGTTMYLNLVAGSMVKPGIFAAQVSIGSTSPPPPASGACFDLLTLKLIRERGLLSLEATIIVGKRGNKAMVAALLQDGAEVAFTLDHPFIYRGSVTTYETLLMDTNGPFRFKRVLSPGESLVMYNFSAGPDQMASKNVVALAPGLLCVGAQTHGAARMALENPFVRVKTIVVS
jgi:hypothetical protein